MARVLLLHPGQMGAVVAAALVETGHAVSWRPAGRSEQTRVRALQAGLREGGDLSTCDAVLSICPPSAALQTATTIRAFSGLYLDANAVSPSTADEVARTVRAAGADYVDGGIVGPPPQRPGTTRLYLSGARAAQAAELFAGTRVDARVLTTSPFAASALKMTYAAWTKISAALLLTARETAGILGVEDALDSEWALSQPALPEAYTSARASAAAKGWRWEEEMRQIATTFDEAGQPAGFATGAAEVFGRYPRP